MPGMPDPVMQAEDLNQEDLGGDQKIMQFSQEEIENLREIFNLFDKDK